MKRPQQYPLVEVKDASPVLDEKVYILSLFPHYQQELPNDMVEGWHGIA
jgi:hypothetical protein